MKVLRITVMKVEQEGAANEALFNQRLTERFLAKGFDLNETIIKQTRSDVAAIDFIQLRYTWWDTILAHLQYDVNLMVNWVNRQFGDPDRDALVQPETCKCGNPFKVGMVHKEDACYFPEHKPKI